MYRFISRLLLITLFCLGCQHVAPTPILVIGLTNANDATVQLYNDCSEGVNYKPDKDTCDSEALEAQTVTTMDLAKNFISADINQPIGYDIYLKTAEIYFRIALRNGNDYSEAERISRQFFEVQKASSGRALTDARYYWTIRTAAHAGWQLFNNRSGLNPDRKTELMLSHKEGTLGLQDMKPGPRKIRLQESLKVLKSIIDALP